MYSPAKKHDGFAYFVIYYLFNYLAGVEPSPVLLRPLIGLLYQPWMTMIMEQLVE
jgi:hypothetical protein